MAAAAAAPTGSAAPMVSDHVQRVCQNRHPRPHAARAGARRTRVSVGRVCGTRLALGLIPGIARVTPERAKSEPSRVPAGTAVCKGGWR